MYKFSIPRKNQHWVYFYHSNLKVGPFGPPLVALGLSKLQIKVITANGDNRRALSIGPFWPMYLIKSELAGKCML